jgi:hypothetical protein
MQEAGAVEETGQQKIVGKRPAQLFRYALDDFNFTFPRMLETPRNSNKRRELRQNLSSKYHFQVCESNPLLFQQS